MPKILESWNEFCRRQGCEFIVAGRAISPRTGDDVDRVVFANGAVSDTVNHYDPSPDAKVRMATRHEYLTALLRREEKDFRAFQQACIEQASLARVYTNLPGPPADAAEQLKAGQQRIQKIREELATINAQLEDKAETARRMAEQQRQDGIRSRNAAALQSIAGITI